MKGNTGKQINIFFYELLILFADISFVLIWKTKTEKTKTTTKNCVTFENFIKAVGDLLWVWTLMNYWKKMND